MTCRIVATEWVWSRGRGSSDVILTSNTGPLFFGGMVGRLSNIYFYIRCFYARIFSSYFCSTVKSIFILFVFKSNGILTLDGESRMDVGERIRKFRNSLYLAIFNTN